MFTEQMVQYDADSLKFKAREVGMRERHKDCVQMGSGIGVYSADYQKD